MNFLSFFKFLFILTEVLFLFNLIIVVHELGHFWAARWRGMVVEKFGIWFGKPIWKKTIQGVEYSLGWIPYGGYVSLPQMGPMDKIEGRAEEGMNPAELPPVKPLDKIIVAIAGPLASFTLAILVACLVSWIGRPVGEAEATTMIGYVAKDSPASKAGLQVGDKILEIDHFPVHRFQGMSQDAITWRIVSSEGTTIHIKFERQGAVLETDVIPYIESRKFYQRKALRQIEIDPAQTPMVARVFPQSPAARAGILPNDLIQAVNGQKLYSIVGLSEYMEAHPHQDLVLDVLRGNVLHQISVHPEIPLGMNHPMVGLEWDRYGKVSLIYPSVHEQIMMSVNSMMNTLNAIFSPKSNIKPEHLSGPVMIMRVYYMIFESDHAWRRALWFCVFFNVNLAILNMLPFPILDGGHILFASLELITRRALSLKVLEWIQTTCFALVLSFFLYITFFDLQDLPVPWKKKPEAPELHFAPQP